MTFSFLFFYLSFSFIMNQSNHLPSDSVTRKSPSFLLISEIKGWREEMIWYDTIRSNLIWYDVIWYDIWYSLQSLNNDFSQDSYPIRFRLLYITLLSSVLSSYCQSLYSKSSDISHPPHRRSVRCLWSYCLSSPWEGGREKRGTPTYSILQSSSSPLTCDFSSLSVILSLEHRSLCHRKESVS